MHAPLAQANKRLATSPIQNPSRSQEEHASNLRAYFKAKDDIKSVQGLYALGGTYISLRTTNIVLEAAITGVAGADDITREGEQLHDEMI